MRFLLEKIPENNDFDPEIEGYHAIGEPSVLKLCLLAMPVIVISVFIIGLMLKIRFGANYHLSMTNSWRDVFLFVALIPIHEMLHVILYPDRISFAEIFIGSYKGSIYRSFLGDMKKERLLLQLIFPIIILTVIPVLFLMISNINYPLLSKIAIMNMVLSSLDVISFCTIFKRIPANAKVRNNGHHTYWKL